MLTTALCKKLQAVMSDATAAHIVVSPPTPSTVHTILIVVPMDIWQGKRCLSIVILSFVSGDLRR